MILDATKKHRPHETGKIPVDRERRNEQVQHLKSLDPRILDIYLVHDTLLLVQVSGHGMPLIEKLVKHTELPGIKIIATVSEDVDIRDKENYIWGIFTRFDCERDISFTEQRLLGISPIYKGIMGIDATWKNGYPKPLKMTDDVAKGVEERWESYWK